MRSITYLLPWFCFALLLLLVSCGQDDLSTNSNVPDTTVLNPTALNQPNIQPTETLKILIPLYVDPVNNRADWVKVANAADKVTMNVIVNPSGGPLGCQTPQFQEALNLLTTRGITVLGYVPTGFGNRDINAVQSDISNYQSCSQFGGIFLDEVSREASQIDNIRSMCSFVHGAPQFARTVLNSGSQLDPRILEDVFCDTVVSFESNINNWISSYNPKSVTTAIPDLFAGLIYGTSTESVFQAVDLARQRGLGHIYMSGDFLPNPWSRLTVYWEPLVDYIALGNNATTPTPIPTPTPTPIPTPTPTPSPDSPPSTPSSPTDGNLLVNPSFQNGLSGWQIDDCGSGSASISGDASNGSAAVALADETICIGQSVKVTAEKSYTLTCDVKNVGSGYGDVGLYGKDSELGLVEITGSSYAPISMTGFSSGEYLYISLYHESQGTSYIDNCSLTLANTSTTPHPPITGEPVTPTPIPPAIGNNLLRNPSFETGLVAWELSDCGTGEIRSSNDASAGNNAMQLIGGTACVGQVIEAIPSGVYTVSCDIKNEGNNHVDIGLYAEGVELNTTVIPSSSSYSRLSVQGYVSDKDSYLGVYIYKKGQGNIVVDNCTLIEQ